LKGCPTRARSFYIGRVVAGRGDRLTAKTDRPVPKSYEVEEVEGPLFSLIRRGIG